MRKMIWIALAAALFVGADAEAGKEKKVKAPKAPKVEAAAEVKADVAAEAAAAPAAVETAAVAAATTVTGNVKSVDAAGKLLTVTVDGKDVVFSTSKVELAPEIATGATVEVAFEAPPAPAASATAEAVAADASAVARGAAGVATATSVNVKK